VISSAKLATDTAPANINLPEFASCATTAAYYSGFTMQLHHHAAQQKMQFADIGSHLASVSSMH
jgi:hypothetical protein